MLLKVYDTQTIADIQENFAECFPWLQIEFYKNHHKWRHLNDAEDRIETDKLIGEIRNNHDPGVLEIKSWYQAGRVEQEFYRRFGLHVQIFRKEGSRWVQTGDSDKLTLLELKDLEHRG